MNKWLWWRRNREEEISKTPLPDVMQPPARSFLEEGRYIIENPPSTRGHHDEKSLGIACVAGRRINADFALVNGKLILGGDRHILWGVFDGVSSSFEPEVSGRLAAEEFGKVPRCADATGYLRGALESGNRVLLDYIDEGFPVRGMNPMTTASVAVYNPHKRELTIGHVGDSRIYLVGDSEVRMLTEDHRGLKRDPELSASLGFESMKPFIYKVVGDREGIRPQIEKFRVPVGSQYLCLVTDGLYGPLSKPEGYNSIKAWESISIEANNADTLEHAEILRRYDEDAGRFEKTMLKALSDSGWNLQRAAETIVKLADADTSEGRDDKTVILARL
jgi:serine/threonine protein phosphatase PrpC